MRKPTRVLRTVREKTFPVTVYQAPQHLVDAWLLEIQARDEIRAEETRLRRELFEREINRRETMRNVTRSLKGVGNTAAKVARLVTPIGEIAEFYGADGSVSNIRELAKAMLHNLIELNPKENFIGTGAKLAEAMREETILDGIWVSHGYTKDGWSTFGFKPATENQIAKYAGVNGASEEKTA